MQTRPMRSGRRIHLAAVVKVELHSRSSVGADPVEIIHPGSLNLVGRMGESGRATAIYPASSWLT